MIEETIKDAESRMKKSLEALNQEFAKLRTGRAHASLLDQVTVEYYGSQVPLNQAATIGVEDARTLAVSPWDKNMVQPIEKAIMASDLGLNPSTSGDVIRIVIPALNEERRKELVKIVRAGAETARVAVRNVRRDANQDLKEWVKEKEISEDQQHRAEQRIQELTDQHIDKIEQLLERKEQEMMQV